VHGPSKGRSFSPQQEGGAQTPPPQGAPATLRGRPQTGSRPLVSLALTSAPWPHRSSVSSAWLRLKRPARAAGEDGGPSRRRPPGGGGRIRCWIRNWTRVRIHVRIWLRFRVRVRTEKEGRPPPRPFGSRRGPRGTAADRRRHRQGRRGERGREGRGGPWRRASKVPENRGERRGLRAQSWRGGEYL